MKISPITSFASHKINSLKTLNKFNNFPILKSDTISFCAKSKTSPNIQAGIEFGKDLNNLYNNNELTFANIEEIIKKRCSIPVEIKPLEADCNNAIVKSGAHMHPEYNKNMELESAIIYINKQEITEKPEVLITKLAHEFTHIIQRQNSDDYLGFKKYVSSLEHARIANYIQVLASNDFAQQYLDEKSQLKWLSFYDARKDTETTSLKVLTKLPSNSTLKKQANDSLNKTIAKIIKEMEENSISKKDLEGIEKLKPMIKKAVIRRFEMEAEAEKVNIALAKMLPNYENYLLFIRTGIMHTYEKFVTALNSK